MQQNASNSNQWLPKNSKKRVVSATFLERWSTVSETLVDVSPSKGSSKPNAASRRPQKSTFVVYFFVALALLVNAKS